MKKIRIKSAPQYASGGWAQQVGGRLNTPWPPGNATSFNNIGTSDVRTTLPKVPRSMANAVLENDEIAMLPTDQGMAVQEASSGSHASGNDHPTILDQGTMIISDTKDLKEKSPVVQSMFNKPYKKGGYTYTELAKPFMNHYNRATKELTQKDLDPLRQKTLELNKQNAGQKLQQVFMAQEFAKDMKNIPSTPAPRAMFGGMLPKTYAEGGFRFDEDLLSEQQRLQQQNPVAVNIANQLYGQPNTRSFTDNVDGPRTQFVRNWAINTPSNDNIGTLPTSNTNMPTSQPSPYMDEQVPGGNLGNNTGVGDILRNIKIKGKLPNMSADNIADMAMLAKSLSVKSYMPWEAPIQIARPDLILESDQPIRNVLAEQTNQLSNAIYAGDSRAARAGAQNAQAQMLAKAVQAAGEVSNRNVQNYNQYSTMMANLDNTRLMQERDRSKRLYDGSVIASQQLVNSRNAINDMWAKAAAEREQRDTFIHNQNKLNPYYQLDSTGKLHFVPGMNFEKMKKATGTTNDWAAVAEQLQAAENAGLTREEAMVFIKNGRGITETTTKDTKTGTVKTTTKTKKKFGGYMSMLPKK
jgi:hypothetical protein